MKPDQGDIAEDLTTESNEIHIYFATYAERAHLGMTNSCRPAINRSPEILEADLKRLATSRTATKERARRPPGNGLELIPQCQRVLRGLWAHFWLKPRQNGKLSRNSNSST